MAIKKLDDQIQEVENRITNALLYPSSEAVGIVHAEFKKLLHMLDGLTSFTSHRWEVKLFGRGWASELVDIRAEHLVEAREKASDMVDEFDAATRYELYCDGNLIPEDN